MYRSAFKPLLDWIIALTALLILSPILLLVMLTLAVANRGAIWFVQERPGHRERVFRVIKFKTMTDAKDAKGNLLPDEHRLKGFGKWVRATSLDELPQLFNVLLGEMSLVGPRPLLPEYLPLYDTAQRKRHDVRPGITGWAQVNGRNAISWKEKFALDSWYVDHLSFALDSKILLLTLVNVFRARGITSATSVTMEKFRGNG